MQGLGFAAQLLTLCKVPGAAWDGSPAVPLLAPVLSLVKQSKLLQRGPPHFNPFVCGWNRVGKAVGHCFLSLCDVPLQDRDVGDSCPIALANNQRVFYWFRGKFDLRTLNSFPALWCQCQACGTSLSCLQREWVGSWFPGTSPGKVHDALLAWGMLQTRMRTCWGVLRTGDPFSWSWASQGSVDEDGGKHHLLLKAPTSSPLGQQHIMFHRVQWDSKSASLADLETVIF